MSRTSTWILCGIVFAALALRLYTFVGYFGADDGEYARLANAMVEGNLGAFIDENYIRNFHAPAHLRFRLALIAPLALLFGLFGISEWVLVSYPLLISLLGVVLAFLCGRFMFGVNAGLVAAALWAVLPVDVKLATEFLPDAIAIFYASAGVLVLLWARESATKQAYHGLLGGLAAGLLFGLSWLSKESIVYLVPLCGLLLIVDFRADFRKALPLWTGVAAASGGILLAEMITYGILNGDFLLRMHENERKLHADKVLPVLRRQPIWMACGRQSCQGPSEEIVPRGAEHNILEPGVSLPSLARPAGGRLRRVLEGPCVSDSGTVDDLARPGL